MNATGTPTAASRPAGGRRLLFPESWPAAVRGGVLLALATWFAFGSLGRAPWLQQDFAAMRAAIAHPFDGWPGANASVKLDHSWAGIDGRIHQAANLGLHFLSGLLLFVVLRFALRRSSSPAQAGGREFFPALGGALLWLLHPFHVDALPGLAGRGVLLAGMLLLFPLWAFAVSTSRCRMRWRVLALLAVIAGMATHGSMIAAPFLLLLFDRAFLAPGWREVWLQRGRWHLAFLAAAGIGITFVIRTAGTGSALAQLTQQLRSAGWYLQRTFWPHPLIYDHGPGFAPGTGFVVAVILAAGTLFAVVRSARWGLVAAWFWLTLAFAAWDGGGASAVTESRLVLPLMALAFAAAIVAARFGRVGGMVLVAGAIGLGALSRARTTVHDSAMALWSDTVAKVPTNPRAHFELGQAFAAAGRVDAALEQFDETVQLAPRDRDAHLQLAELLVQAGRLGEAVAEYETCLKLDPDFVAAHLGLAALQFRLGRAGPAESHYAAAVRLGVSAAERRRQQGRVLAEAGRFEEALIELDAALQLAPEAAETRLLRGMVLSAAGRPEEGMTEFFAAVRLQPDNAGAHTALGDALLEDHRPSEALSHYETALRLQPARWGPLHASMGGALTLLGRAPEAIVAYEEALRANPDDEAARISLERVRVAAERHGGRKK